jgi:hypothetical protein
VSSPELVPQPILRGRLEELDFGSLLSALRLGRQYLTLEVYDAAGDCTGVVAVKAGRIVSASVDGYTGIDAVQRLLQRRDASEFRVLPQPSAAEIAAEPLGTIAAITQEVTRSTESKVDMLIARTQIMQGLLSEQLRFEDVLRGLAFTRQHITLAVSDVAGRALGEVAVKANKVLSARAGDKLALAALQQLRQAPLGSRFVLFVESRSVAHLRPLGTVGEVLERIKRPSLDAQGRSSNGAHRTSAWSTQTANTTHDASGASAANQGRILQGNLEEFRLSHVLSVLSTSRQHFEVLVKDEAATPVGAIEVKSGMVVAAKTDKLTGVAAAHELLRPSKGHFVAVRRIENSAELPSLLSLHQLLQPFAATRASATTHPREDTQSVFLSRAVEVKAPDTTDAKPITVMSGELGELDVASILHVAGSSRQYTCVRIFDDERTSLGAVFLKSGQVVRAQAQDVTGVLAVRRLLHCPSDFSFLVERYPQASEVKSSIGSVADVLTRAAAQPTAAAAAVMRAPAATITEDRSQPRAAPGNSWIGGAALGAGFVLLGGIAAALVLRTPTLTTSISPMSVAEKVAPAQAELPQARAEIQSAKPPAQPQETATEEVAPSAPVPTEPLTAMSRATVASLQAALQQLGYATGPIDGVIGTRTAAAIQAFQYAEHLTVDGRLNAATRAVLSRRMEEP